MFNGTTTTHTYGSDGLRRRTVKGADTTDYILDGDSVIRTLQNGVLDKTYFHGLRGPEYERTGAGNPTWYVYDGLGSVVGLLDVNGSLVSTRKYDVYGSVRGGTGISGSKHKFVGSLGHPSEDDAGLIYMRARWMDPTTGTFASEDPARDGENWFGYADCRPVQHIDPDGRMSLSEEGEASAGGAELDATSGGGSIPAKRWMTNKLETIYHRWANKHWDSLKEFKTDFHYNFKQAANNSTNASTDHWFDVRNGDTFVRGKDGAFEFVGNLLELM